MSQPNIEDIANKEYTELMQKVKVTVPGATGPGGAGSSSKNNFASDFGDNNGSGGKSVLGKRSSEFTVGNDSDDDEMNGGGQDEDQLSSNYAALPVSSNRSMGDEYSYSTIEVIDGVATSISLPTSASVGSNNDTGEVAQSSGSMSVNSGAFAPPLPPNANSFGPPAIYIPNKVSLSSQSDQANTPINRSSLGGASNITTSSLSTSLKVLRFERVGWNEWNIKETRVFDLNSFFQSIEKLFLENINSLFLINEQRINPSDLQRKRLVFDCSDSKGDATADDHNHSNLNPAYLKLSLEEELSHSGAIITSWPQYDFQQFKLFIKSFHESTASEANSPRVNSSGGTSSMSKSLYDYWYKFDNQKQPIENSGSPIMGYIGYEVSQYMMIIVRKNSLLAIHNDIWVKIFPNELLSYSNRSNNTFSDLMISFFPQLSQVERRLRARSNNSNPTAGSSGITYSLDDVYVKYYSTNKPYQPSSQSNQSKTNNTADEGSSSIDNSTVELDIVPAMVSGHCYQTIGTLNTPINKVLTR